MIFYGLIPMDLVNWPGKVAATIFTSGCNLRCPYCHNPDLVLNQGVDTFTEEQIIEFVGKRKGLQGLVISGGEPTIHKDLSAFIRKVKETTGIPIKLDTNGTRPEIIENLIKEKLLDYVAMDLKAPWHKYKDVGFGNVGLIQKSLEILKTNDVPFELRTTCSKDLLSKQDIETIIGIAESCVLHLQPFDPHSTLDPEWATAIPWTKEELQQIAARHTGVFVR